jgi:hypothetical protein
MNFKSKNPLYIIVWITLFILLAYVYSTSIYPIVVRKTSTVINNTETVLDNSNKRGLTITEVNLNIKNEIYIDGQPYYKLTSATVRTINYDNNSYTVTVAGFWIDGITGKANLTSAIHINKHSTTEFTLFFSLDNLLVGGTHKIIIELYDNNIFPWDRTITKFEDTIQI